ARSSSRGTEPPAAADSTHLSYSDLSLSSLDTGDGWMFVQFSETLAGLQLPLRVVVKGGPTLDLTEDPRVTLLINDPNLLGDMQAPTLDKLGDAYVSQRTDIQRITIDVTVVTDRASKGLLGELASPPVERTEHDRHMYADAISCHYGVSNVVYTQWLDPHIPDVCVYFGKREDM